MHPGIQRNNHFTVRRTRRCRRLSVLCPLVLSTNLLLFLRSEVVGDVEGLPDLFGRFALDHVGHSFAANVEERLDIQIV